LTRTNYQQINRNNNIITHTSNNEIKKIIIFSNSEIKSVHENDLIIDLAVQKHYNVRYIFEFFTFTEYYTILYKK